MRSNKLFIPTTIFGSWAMLLSCAEMMLCLGVESQQLTPEPPAQRIGSPGNGVYAVTEAGPHHRRWERVVTRKTERGDIQSVTNSYVELATGMNAWSEADRSWLPASDEIEIFEGAAVARRSQHKVVFSANLADENGTVDLLTSDGNRLRSSVVGLAYTDSESGKSLSPRVHEPSETNEGHQDWRPTPRSLNSGPCESSRAGHFPLRSGIPTTDQIPSDAGSM